MATNNTAPATKVIVPCRISFANIWEARSINGSEEKYSVSLLIPKDDKATLAKIKKAIEAAKEAAKEKKWSGKIPPNRHVQPILDPMECGSGDYCNVSVNFYGFAASGNKGIAAGLQNIQLVRHGERLAGRPTAASDFVEVEGDDADDLADDDLDFLN